MKNYFILLFVFVISNTNAQVGINTDSPTAGLDVNGNARIRTVEKKLTFAATDHVLIVDEEGNIKKASLNDVYRQVYINNTVFSGMKVSDKLLDVSLGKSTYKSLLLDGVELGNQHYNTTTGAYTVPEDGIYNIVYYFKYGTGLSLAVNVFSPGSGIGIIKESNSVFSVLDNIAFGGVHLGIGLVGVDLNLSEATLNRTFKLNKNDKIYLAASNSLLTVSLLSSTKATGHIYKISN